MRPKSPKLVFLHFQILFFLWFFGYTSEIRFVIKVKRLSGFILQHKIHQ